MTVGDWGPGQASFDDRVKRAGKQFVFAHSVVPVVTLAAYIAFAAAGPLEDRTTFLPAILLYAVIVFFVVRWARRQSLRPGRWVRAASFSGGIAGFFLGSPALGASGIFTDVAMTQNVGRIMGVMVGALAGGCLLGIFVARSLATRAKRTLLEPLDAALIHSPVEISWPARGDRRRSLAVGTDRITLHANYGESRGYTKAHSLTMLTESQQVVDDRGGPAVRIVVAGEEWVFPTDEPDKILYVLRERARMVAAR